MSVSWMDERSEGSCWGVELTHTEADEERKIDCAGNVWFLYLGCTNGDSLPETG